MASAFQANAFQASPAFQIEAVVEEVTGRGRGGWGAGLNARRRGQPTPLSRIRKLSELDELPPKPQIVKPSIHTPAVTLAPSLQDEEEELVVAMIVHGII